jgi:hypothetical protein
MGDQLILKITADEDETPHFPLPNDVLLVSSVRVRRNEGECVCGCETGGGAHASGQTMGCRNVWHRELNSFREMGIVLYRFSN